jgi:hypothetical protein
MFVLMLMASVTMGVEGTSTVSEVKMSGLEVWEASALPGVFASEHADQYLHFRTYALTILSDAGLLDHLLDALGTGILRVIDSVGGQTGMQVRLADAANARTRSAGSSDGSGGDSNAVAAAVGMTLLAVLAKSKAMVKRMLRRGPPSRLLDSVCPDANSNVLSWIVRMDKRYFPITVEMQDKSRRAFNSWEWNSAQDFYFNMATREQLLQDMNDCGLETEVPGLRGQWNLVKLAILNKVPMFQSSIDYVERATDGPCRGSTRVLTTDNWIDMEQCLANRYDVTMRSVPQQQSTLRVPNRVSFVARPNDSATPMTKRTMHPSLDPGITPAVGTRKQDQSATGTAGGGTNATNNTNSNTAPTDTLGGDKSSRRGKMHLPSKMESWAVCGKKWYNEKLKTYMICDWRLDPDDPKCPKDHPTPKAKLARLVSESGGAHIGHCGSNGEACVMETGTDADV